MIIMMKIKKKREFEKTKGNIPYELYKLLTDEILDEESCQK